MKRSLRCFLLIGLLPLLSACGVKTAYNNADWLLMRSINDRVELTSQQEREVSRLLEDSLAWHCASELPDYAAFLRRVDRDVVAGRIDRSTIDEYGETVSTFGRRLLERFQPAVIDLLAGLSDAQVEQLMTSFEERNSELLAEAEAYGEEDSIQERAEGFEKGMRRFSGRLTETQRQRLLAWSRALQPSAELTLERRLRWQSEFRRVMALRRERDRFDSAMAGLLEPGGLMPEALEARRAHNRSLTIETVIDIHQLAPPAQIEALRDNLADLSEDLEQLSCSS